MRWAIGVANLMPESGFSASEMKFNSSRMVLFMRYVVWFLFTIFAAFFIAKLICRWWSEIFPVKVFVVICFTRFLKPLELFSKSLVLLLRANAREVYRCDMILNIQGVSSPNLASFPTSFCMSLTQKVLNFVDVVVQYSYRHCICINDKAQHYLPRSNN